MPRLRSTAFLSTAFLLLTGCGLTSVSRQTQITPATALTQIGGSVHGGNQPVTNATIQLWQVGTGGYGSTPATLGSSVITGPGGNFNITGDYCSNGSSGNNTFVYVTATGGNPGFADPATNNTGLVLMAALGTCGSLTPSTFVTINEVTTVASVYALQQFMNTSGGIGSFSGYATGLSNAFATVNTLVNLTSGAARSAAVAGTKANILPAATLNTLANILVPCVNSSSSSSSACTSLFSAATPPGGGVAPPNTLVAALDIAQNPVQLSNSSYISTLFNLSNSNAAFQPTLSSAPNDWTLSVGYAQNGNPISLAVDATGNVWTTAGSGTSSFLAEMSTSGVPASNSPYNNANFNSAYGLALDTGGNAWVTNSGTSSLMQLQLISNAITSLNLYDSIGLSAPEGIMLDSNSNLWIADNASNSVTEYNPGTSALTQYTSGGLSAPVALASDLNGNTWVTNSNGGSITSIPQYSGGNSPGYAAHTGGGLSTPAGLAIDSGGYLWVTDSSLSEVAEINSSGDAVTTSSGDTGGGLTNSFADAIDGGSNIWVADYSGNRLTKLLPAGQSGAPATPSTGFLGGLGGPKSIAIDPSGNIWLGNSAPVNGATITEFIGLASPATSPLQQNLFSGSIGTRPGTLNFGPGFQSNAELGVSYSNTFSATGGSGNYSWFITTGLSALQAAGFTFSTAGVLSGTPTSTGTFPFTVQVTDTTNNITASKSYSLTVTTPPATSCTHDGSGNAILNGHYAFLLTGFDPNGHFYDEIGSFKADGAGNLSSGDADVNGDQNLSAFSSGEQQYNFTGTYSAGSTDDRGILNFANSNGTGTAGLPINTSFCFAADDITSGVAYSGRLIQADGSGYVLTGFFNIQNATDFGDFAIIGGYVFGLQGVDGTTPNRHGMIGQFNANGAGVISSGQFDTSGATGSSGSYTNAYSAANVMAAGSYTLGANGRGTMSFTVGGVSLPFIVYMTGNGTQLLMLSQNAGPSGNTPLLAGKALVQLTSNFTAATVTGAGIFRATATTNPNSPPLEDKDSVGQLTFDGAGHVGVLADQNGGGSIGTPATNNASGTYSVSSLGYLTLGGLGNSPNFYLYGAAGGFGLDSTTGVSSYYMLQQTIPSGGFSSANLASNLTGSYALGTVFPLTYNVSSSLISNGNQYPSIFDADLSFNSGAFSIVQDNVSAPGTPASSYVQAGTTQSGTYSLDPTYGPGAGRFLLQQNSQNIVVGYIINPSTAFFLTTTSDQNPQLIEADHH